jgi:anaerobic selenocysteine-containing dehydrogenase
MATGTSEAKVTTDHEEIRRWVEKRGGHPARVKGTERGESAGLLRIDYPGYSGEGKLEEITWDEFFEGFEENNLAFLYQEKTKDGEESRFSKLVDRDKAEEE